MFCDNDFLWRGDPRNIRRYVNGNESSPNAKDIGNDVEPLAEATYNIIKKL